jgi:hypothetical protein
MARHAEQYSAALRTEESKQTLKHGIGDNACVSPVDFGSSLLYQSGQILQ